MYNRRNSNKKGGQLMKQKIYIILVIIMTFISGIWVNKYYYSKQKINQTEYNIDAFKNVVTKVKSSFNVDGYENILGNSGYTVAVPDSVAGRQDFSLEGLYSREQNFIYKNPNNSVVILMSITANKKISTEKEWQHSIGYESRIHNSKTNNYKNYYSGTFSTSDVYLYSFASQGYNISLVAISENLSNQEVFTASELVRFTDKLVNFLKEQNIK